MRLGITDAEMGLGVRSIVLVPLSVGGERRGVLEVVSAQPELFTEDDLSFLEAVAYWVGTLTHWAELAQRIAEAAAEEARQVTATELVTVLAHDVKNYITPIMGHYGTPPTAPPLSSMWLANASYLETLNTFTRGTLTGRSSGPFT